MHDYRYSIVRFVADPARMEPVNVGIILQGQGRIDLKLNPHAAKRKDIDTATFQQWRKFLTEEIQGDAVPLFHPPKHEEEFLVYLSKLCEGPILLSRPLLASVDDKIASSELLERLYDRLVAPPTTDPSPEADRPTGRFRQLMDDYDFLRRGMKRHAHIQITNSERWMPYRHVQNEALWAIDKIEVANQIGQTAGEIQAMEAPLRLIDKFLANGNGKYFLLADRFVSKFAEQPDDEFELMREDLEQTVEKVRSKGGTVIRDPLAAQELAMDLDKHLPAAS